MRKRNKYILIGLGAFFGLILVAIGTLQIIAMNTVYPRHVNLYVKTSQEINEEFREYVPVMTKFSEDCFKRGEIYPLFYLILTAYNRLEAKKEYVDYLFEVYLKNFDKTPLVRENFEQQALIWSIKSNNKELAKKLTHLKNPFWLDAKNNFLEMTPKELSIWLEKSIINNKSKLNIDYIDLFENIFILNKDYEKAGAVNMYYHGRPSLSRYELFFTEKIMPMSKIAKYSILNKKIILNADEFIKDFYDIYLRDKVNNDSLIEEYPWVKLRFNYIQKAIKKFNIKVPSKKAEITK